MSIRTRVYNISTHLQGVTALRLGRIVGMEQKGELDNVSDEEIERLLTTSDADQVKEDNLRKTGIAHQRDGQGR